MADIKKTLAEQKKASGEQTKQEFAFGKINYILLLVGLALLLLGYVLMIGGGSEDPNVFSESLFDFQRLTLAPLLLIAGFVVEIFAIMIKPKESRQ